MSGNGKKTQEGYIVEFIKTGNSVKVTAIDPRSGREVSIVASPKTTRQQMIDVAVRKLQYVLAKEALAKEEGA